MIGTTKKSFDEILEALRGFQKIGMVGCGQTPDPVYQGGEGGMKLTAAFKKPEFVITSEVGPMKGCVRNGHNAGFVEIATRLLKEIAPMVRGVHFMPLGWSDLVPQLAAVAKNAAR